VDIPAPPGTKVSPEAWALLTDDNDPDNPLSELIAHIRINELWDAHRDYIVAEWVARRPGTRPNRWWLTDEDGKPRLRQQVGGMQYVAYDSWCGAPRIVSGRPVSNETAVFESQAGYLLRNSLLHLGELERLTPTDFLPFEFAIPAECFSG